MPIEYSVLIMDLGSDDRLPAPTVVLYRDYTGLTTVNHYEYPGRLPDICQTLKDSERAFPVESIDQGISSDLRITHQYYLFHSLSGDRVLLPGTIFLLHRHSKSLVGFT